MKRIKHPAAGAAVILLFTAFSPASFAQDYQMALVPGHAGVDLIQKGDLEEAIAHIAPCTDHPFAAYNNLCVAHTLAEQFDDANAMCEKAVATARHAWRLGRYRNQADHYANDLAIALSNRGVMRARSGDTVAAETDFREAVALHADTHSPARNLALLTATD